MSELFARRCRWWGLALAILAGFGSPAPAAAQSCARTLFADVVAFDQVFFWNRLGAVQPQGMMYALRRDVTPISGSVLSPGNVKLRATKRPRPLVLRMNAGDCLEIRFQNYLNSVPVDQEQPATRYASVHANGLQLVGSMASDGSNVGTNTSSLVAPGGSAIYTYYAEREGEHVIYSAGAMTGGQGNGGQLNPGLFGAVIVEPAGSRWYRSQVTRADMMLATAGTTAYSQPVINYEAIYGVGQPRAGLPILNMLSGTEIVSSDLTAVIVGSAPQGGGAKAGWYAAGTFPNHPINPEREQPFREFVTLYHDETGAVQAFPQFENSAMAFTLHSGRDAFAINYGSAGVGAEVLANRLGVGPMATCNDCKFEEFFLSAWTVGDPAMVVDVPANAPCTTADIRAAATSAYGSMPCTPTPGKKATKAFYPDDPSNVYHSYLSDHTRFRVLHGGSKEHHVHHLHAHQWLNTPDSDKSTYLDSQAFGPGTSFTTEIAHSGSGNANLTVGDSIFHCHFYPHFAQGMWALWRVHDVFEQGTMMDGAGKPAANSRALPDGEIAAGTPIPGLVPLPGKPMPRMPEATVSIVNGQAQVMGPGNPGFPFFVPGVAGHRPPKPPLDTIDDGGLPRHVITGGTVAETHTRLDFHKTLLTATATPLAETGTLMEQRAMAYHAVRDRPSCLPNGTCDGALAVKFLTNGRPAVAGAPYADPCVNAQGQAVAMNRRYKAADIQTDVKLNKAGWHFPQSRFSALWDDVASYLTPGGKPPEPLFFRANTGDCMEYQLTNLVPAEYALDDFQVRTPTDILGQHIHLVKFDVTSSDGAGNGFNYEDGSFAPGEVVERINAIRATNACTSTDARNGTFACPVARAHPFFGAGPGNAYLGAQTTVQRWYVDPVLDNQGKDRTLRTVFTHDHFGPSTHQQTGLYAGLVVEPAGSTWVHNETGAVMGGRTDGGPTSWQAVIDPPGDLNDYREFVLEFADDQLAYRAGNPGFPSPTHVINPPARDEIGLPDILQKAAFCPSGDPLPCPELVTSHDVGTMSVNYRNEPLALRVRNPATNTQAAGDAGDLSLAFSSTVTRSDSALNSQPSYYTSLTNDVGERDPYTPLLRAYENDRVQIRTLVGAHEEGHNFNIHGIKWLHEPADNNSGYRSSQMMGISEHYEFIVPQLIKNPQGSSVDRLWTAGSSTDDLWNGIWGLLRAYSNTRQDLVPLPSNPNGGSGINPGVNGAWDFSCPKNIPVRTFDVSAVRAADVLPFGRLVYNSRTDGSYGPLFDPTALLYVRSSDLDVVNGRLLAGVPIEPLTLRARAGECIQLTLRNRMAADPSDLDGYNTLPMIVDGFNNNDIRPSAKVGLHPQLLYYDVSRYDGLNVGNNVNNQLVARTGAAQTYQWYAGDVVVNPDGTVTATPIEFGATNLISSDHIEHTSKGAFASLIIEPADATWVEDATSRASATVTSATRGTFREFVVMTQNDVNLRTGEGGVEAIENIAEEEDAEDSGAKAINYRTEPMWKRMQYDPDTPLGTTRTFDFRNALSNTQVGGDPQTPVFTARAGQAVRFRLLQAGGHSRNIAFTVGGHIWDRLPYVSDSRSIGLNSLSMWSSVYSGHGPTNHADLVPRNGAGGKFSILGDYLYRDFSSFGFDGGLWGIFRVTP